MTRTPAAFLSILRVHIILIAMMAAMTFGWLIVGRFSVTVVLIGGVDWLLINLLNRITDVAEDALNEIEGTKMVARHPRAFAASWLVILAGSFVASIVWLPQLTLLRVVVQLIGLGYSLPMVPTPKGWKRLKEIYFLKNFMSAVLFVLTTTVYPIAACGWQTVVPSATVFVLVFFFVPFELTYEIIYDMRDLEGDRAAGIPTYPVAHGLERSRMIVDLLLAFSAIVLVAGFAARVVGLRELLIAAAPAVQFWYYRPRYRHGITATDCVRITNLGSALLALYLAGNQLWLWAGLPANIFL